MGAGFDTTPSAVASVNLGLGYSGGESSDLVTDARDSGPDWETCDGNLYGEISFPTPTSAKKPATKIESSAKMVKC